MGVRHPEVPEAVRQKAIALGVEGHRWLRCLPDVLAELSSDWDLVVGPALPGGSEAYVAAATTRDGVDAVLKLEIPEDPGFMTQKRFGTAAWVFAAGRGGPYARLLRHDDKRRALLLERLGPSLNASGLAVGAQIEILCGMLREAWRISAAVPLDSGADKARRLAAFIAETWEELSGRVPSEPWSRRLRLQTPARQRSTQIVLLSYTAMLTPETRCALLVKRRSRRAHSRDLTA